MNVLRDPTKEPHCVDYTGSKKTGPERIADVQQLHPGATYYANPSEAAIYKDYLEYRPEVYCGWIACVYEKFQSD